MTKPVTIPNTFATATTAIPLSNLDADFSTVATALNDANTYSNYAPDTGSANAYVVTLSGVSTTYSAGLRIQFKAGNANTTASTLNVNGGGAKNITYQDATAIASGTIAANSIVDVMYDGTQFLLMNDPAGATGGDIVGPSSATDNAIVRFDGTTGKLVQNSVVTIADSTGDISGVGQLNATTLDATNIEVTNIKAKDGTAAGSIADSTGVVSFTANPVMSGGTANGVLYLNGSKVATSGSALTFDGTALAPDGTGRTLGTTALRWGTVYASAFADGTDQLVGSAGAQARFGYGASWTSQGFAIGGSEQMRLTSTGLGIGTSSPGAKLSIGDTSTTTSNQIRLHGPASGTAGGASINVVNGTDTIFAAGNASNIIGGSYSSDGMIFWGNAALRFYGNSAERMRLDSSGNLGLGVTPSAWSATHKAQQLGEGAVIFGKTNSPLAVVGSNVYNNGTSDLYLTSSNATQYMQLLGAHYWYTAPSGTAGNAITFTQAMTLDASGNLGVGTTSPATRMHISGGTLRVDDTNIMFLNPNYGSGVMAVQGYSNTALAFCTNNTERARITSGGDLLVGTTSQPVGGITARLAVSQSAADYSAIFVSSQTTAANCYGARIQYTGAAPNGTGNAFLVMTDTGGDRAYFRSNGGLSNYQANDTNLSDRREKTNLAPAKSYLDTICAIPVQTFNYIDQSEDDPGLTLGVVAQDVQAVAPELVMESNWGTEDNPKMRLSIYQTDLQYALMKCIQEQQALITSLTARVALLEGN